MEFIDFHTHPAMDDLKTLRDKLQGLGALAAILHPIDIDPTLNLSLKELMMLSNKLNINNTKIVLYEITKLIDGWPDIMLDPMKLWYEVFRQSVSDFFIPFMSINPSFGTKYVKQKLWETDHLSLRGIFVSPVLQFFDPADNKAFHMILEYSEKNNILLTLHLGLPPIIEGNSYKGLLRIALQKLDYILDEYRPDIVISGLGITPDISEVWFKEVNRLMKKFDNIYLTTADINCYAFNDNSVARIKDLGIDRIIFSSGYPYRRARDLMQGVKCISESSLSSNDRDAIFLYNALDLLKYHDFMQYLQKLDIN